MKPLDELVLQQNRPGALALKRAVVLVAVVVVATTGCGSSAAAPASREPTHTSASTVAPAPSPSAANMQNLVGLGATDARWNATHTAATARPNGTHVDPGAYGTCLARRAGECSFEWYALTIRNGRVAGFDFDMPVNTSLAAAKASVIEQAPADTIAGSFVEIHDSNGNVCAIWRLRSMTLGGLFGSNPLFDAQGEIRVEFSQADPATFTYVYSPDDVEEAVVVLPQYGAPPPNDSCR